MKTLFVLLALLAMAVAQMDYYGGEQWKVQMEPCVEFLRQQCSPVALPFVRSRMWQATSCQGMRLRCCRQLARVPEQFRCHAISSAVAQQQLETALQTIPAMCSSVYVPPYCSARCAGGACY